jgi:hypothetical protein
MKLFAETAIKQRKKLGFRVRVGRCKDLLKVLQRGTCMMPLPATCRPVGDFITENLICRKKKKRERTFGKFSEGFGS